MRRGRVIGTDYRFAAARTDGDPCTIENPQAGELSPSVVADGQSAPPCGVRPFVGGLFDVSTDVAGVVGVALCERLQCLSQELQVLPVELVVMAAERRLI